MSHDGCEEVTWKGQAFPYLMHHQGFHRTENYGSARQQGGHGSHSSAASHGHSHAGPISDTLTRAGTGTWNGPAPTGARGAAAQAETAASTAAASGPVKEPDSVRLSNGMRLPMIGFGTAAVKDVEAIKGALELGYRHFDCAWSYGNEDIVGQGLHDFVASGRRSELFITTKVWQTHHRAADVRTSVTESLTRLGLDYVDLVLVHWPEAWLPGSTLESNTPDTEVTIQETWGALEALVDEGKVKAVGVSNFSLKQVEELLSFCRVKPVVNQIELHPKLAQRKLVGVLFRKGVQCVAYSPLGGQDLAEKNDLKDNPVVHQVARELGRSVAQVCLKWNMQRGIPVIPKASSREHQADNLVSMFDWKLSNEHKALLDTLDCGKRYITWPWKQWADPEEGGVAKPSLIVL